MIWLWIFNPPFGLLNYLLRYVGSNPSRGWAIPYRYAALIFMQVVMGGGSSIVLLSAAMNGIPAISMKQLSSMAPSRHRYSSE